MRVLFVENHAELAEAVVSQFLGGHDVVVVPTIAEAKRRLVDARFDVALVDYDLDDGKGDAKLQLATIAAVLDELRA